MKNALKIFVIISLLEAVFIVIILNYNYVDNQANQKELIPYLKKLFQYDLAPEFLGAILSVIVVYTFLFYLGKPVDEWFENNDEKTKLNSSIDAIRNKVEIVNKLIIDDVKKSLVDNFSNIFTSVNDVSNNFAKLKGNIVDLDTMIKNENSKIIEKIEKTFDEIDIKSIDCLKEVDVPRSVCGEATVIKLMFISFDFDFLSTDTKNVISKLLVNNSKIQLLLLHPHSSSFRARCAERNKGQEVIDKKYYERKTLEDHVNLFKNFRTIFKNEGNNVEIKFMFHYPAYVYMNVGNFIWFTPIWSLRSTKVMPMIRLNNESVDIFEKFSEHFDELWALRDNETVALKDLKDRAISLYNDIL